LKTMKKGVYRLNNGDTIKMTGVDYWGRELFDLEEDGKKHRFAMVDGRLHTITSDGEPDCPLKEEYQLDREDLERKREERVRHEVDWSESMEYKGHTLYRVRAVKDMPELGLKKGDRGGWIEDPSKVDTSVWIGDET